ncbi:hypothetical protein AB0C77_28795 [Streptomyces sp. NPDC048629]|uniref:hypothetical protein n=1 Tax=Streptomyces sp. NPDC048629 TaxID=3154824 RepID=UPI00342B345E
MTDARSPLRALRAALFAAVCVTLAAVGHLSMSAHEIPTRTLLLAFAVTGAAAWAVCGRRRGTLAIGAGLLAVQTALHQIFSVGQGRATGTSTMSHAGMDMGGAMDMGAMSTSGAMDMSGAAAGHGALGMTAAHLLAALVCGLWLARGEAALFSLARSAGAAALTPLRLLLAVGDLAVPAPEPAGPVRPRPYARRLHGVVLAHALSRRGPPRLSVPRTTALGGHV